MIRLEYYNLSHANTEGLERLAKSLGINCSRNGTEKEYRAKLIQSIQREEKKLSRMPK